MMNKKKLSLLIAGVSTATILAGSAVFAKPAKEKGQMLYLQQADAGSIQKDSKAGCYSLVLNNVYDHTIYVSEEPRRVTGELTTKEFLDSWKHHELVEKSDPNAILHARMTKEGKRTISDTAVLSNMQYDSKTNSLTYRACPVKKGSVFAEGQIEDISLFIDPFEDWPP